MKFVAFYHAFFRHQKQVESEWEKSSPWAAPNFVGSQIWVGGTLSDLLHPPKFNCWNLKNIGLNRNCLFLGADFQ